MSHCFSGVNIQEGTSLFAGARFATHVPIVVTPEDLPRGRGSISCKWRGEQHDFNLRHPIRVRAVGR